MSDIMYLRIVTREPDEPSRIFDGGDYRFGMDLKLVGGVPVAGLHWSSSDFELCPGCGRFGVQCCSSFRPDSIDVTSVKFILLDPEQENDIQDIYLPFDSEES